MTELERLCVQWQPKIAIAANDYAKLNVFKMLCYNVGLNVGDQAGAIDRVLEIALAHNHFGFEDVDIEAVAVEFLVNGKAKRDDESGIHIESYEAPQANGNGAHVETPAVGKVGLLPFLDMSTWDTTPTPPRQWHVLEHIPSRQPTLISGEGAIGKSILLLQLQAASSLSQPWIGSLCPRPGPTIYLGAEDEQDEIRRRLAAILDHHKARFSDLIDGGFKSLAYAGKDAVLAEFGRSGRIKPTALFENLYAEAVALQPRAVVIDTVSDVFLGDEIKRDQVRQFGSLMRKLAIDANTAVILSSHPSLSGVKSGTGLSGSTQWHNTVRARAYFKKPASGEDDGEGDEFKPDDGRRELQFLKNQFGPLGHRIALRWNNGLWLPPVAPAEDASTADASRMDELFLQLLRELNAQGRNVSDKKGPTYAPARFAEIPKAKQAKASSRALAAAMERLFEAGKVKVVPEGPKSRQRNQLKEVVAR